MLRENKNFLYFLGAQGVSQMGDWVHWVTILSLVYTSTKSGLAIASIPIVLSGTRFLLSSFAGVITDRFNRKSLMIVTNFGQGFLVLLLIFSLSLDGLTQISYILFLTFLISFLSTLHEPTKKSIIPMIVKKREILKANSVLQSLMNSIWILGPLLGGGLITFLGYEAGFVFNSLTFFVSLIFILPLKLPSNINNSPSPFLEEFKQGFGYLKKKKLVLLLTLSTFIMMLGAGGVNALMAAVPKDLYNFTTGMGYSLFLSAVGIGWVFGSSLLVKFSNKIRSKETKVKIWFLSRIISGATIIGVVYAGGFQLAALIWLAHGVFNSFHDSIEDTLIQETVKKKITGRIFGIKGTLEESASIISMAICGLIYEIYNVVASFTYSGSLEIFSAFFLILLLAYWAKNNNLKNLSFNV